MLDLLFITIGAALFIVAGMLVHWSEIQIDHNLN